jgi:hypothetical protein
MLPSPHAESISRESYQKATRDKNFLTDLGTPLHYSALPTPYVYLSCYGGVAATGSAPLSSSSAVPTCTNRAGSPASEAISVLTRPSGIVPSTYNCKRRVTQCRILVSLSGNTIIARMVLLDML